MAIHGGIYQRDSISRRESPESRTGLRQRIKDGCAKVFVNLTHNAAGFGDSGRAINFDPIKGA